jgi:hypothetical protein
MPTFDLRSLHEVAVTSRSYQYEHQSDPSCVDKRITFANRLNTLFNHVSYDQSQ